MKRVLLVCILLLSTGCTSLMPQWRLFQKKVPAPIVKAPEQIETERQTADYIARTVEQPPQLRPMAAKLSESLGRPKKPIATDMTADEADERMMASWQKVLLQSQQQITELNALLAKSEGKKIEGTGVNMFGFSMGGATIALIVICVMFPPVAVILWTIFKRVSGALTTTAAGIARYVKEHPEAGEELKDTLEKTQDKVHKQVISKIKAKLNP